MKLTAFVLSALLGVAVAEEKKPTEPAKPAEPTKPSEPAKPAEPAKVADPAKPAETPTGEIRIYAPTDLEALKAVKGQKIVVEGVVAGLGANKTESIRYLNYTQEYRQSVSLVFFASTGAGVFTKEKLTEFVGKKVRANGILAEHNGALQIKVETLDQLKVQE